MEQSIRIQFPLIEGNLFVVVAEDVDDENIYLRGDPAGLLSLAKVLTTLAQIDQTKLAALPNEGSTEHLPRSRLSANSRALVVGRLDDKRGKFDQTFQPRRKKRSTPVMNCW